jgi:Zn-dependent protease with chaperone function
MLYQSLMMIEGWVRIELWHSIFVGTEEVRHFIPYFFTLNAALAVAGAVAAVGVGISLKLREAHFSLAGLFPELNFVKPPTEVVLNVEKISRRAGVQPPKISIIDSGDPAAFITRSRGGCELAISVGLIESLTAPELEACIAHEMSHLKNNDFVMRSFATVAKVALFTHPLSYLIEPAIYRSRELFADKTAVELVGGRNGLISALSKLRESQNYLKAQPAGIELTCLFAPVGTNWLARLFDKHPSLETRIAVLQED